MDKLKEWPYLVMAWHSGRGQTSTACATLEAAVKLKVEYESAGAASVFICLILETWRREQDPHSLFGPEVQE